VNVHAAVSRASALLDLRRPEEALEVLNGALAVEPDVAQLHCLSGLAHLQRQSPGQALTSGSAAVVRAPELEWGHRICAVALMKIPGRWEDARRAALEAVRLAPESAPGHIVLASALQAAGDRAGALAAARHAIALDPYDADAHSTLGEILFAQDRPDEAIPAYQQALALDPEDADALNNLAVARLRAYQRAGTVEQFEAVARMDPRHEIARHNLLHTGPAGRSFVWRRFSTAAAVLAVLMIAAEPAAVITFALVAAVFEILRVLDVRRLSVPTRQLLADDRRARRLKPMRWDWSWPFRLRPWWWLLAEHLYRDVRRAHRRRQESKAGSWRPPA
jgi:tetratricopeptide (TPR) repeat protein